MVLLGLWNKSIADKRHEPHQPYRR
jgi:hypothetical protein